MDDVALVREKTDIIQLLSEYIPLKKAGRNFKANCPFHNENTPSFMVSVERQMWHCFGCQKGGDAYSFLMEYEHMEFPEALRFLAKRAGVTLHEGPRSSALTSRKEKIYELNRYAASFYNYILTAHPAGKKALLYLQDRKVKSGTINTFRIGFAPASAGNALVRYLLKKKGCTEEDIIDSGLGTRRMGRLMDFFTDRLMFPLIDHRDNVVGFSGRILVTFSDGPKYINTKETPVYHKGEQFFGINIARERMRKEDSVILVEGEFDVIACFQEGIENVVAIKGTALTEAQVRLLSRFVKKVIIAFDDDSAGQEALVRSLVLLEGSDLSPLVIRIPGGKDPDEAIKNDPYAFKQALKNDLPVYDYLLERKIVSVSMKDVASKKTLGDFFLPLFANIRNEIIKEHYIKKLSKLLDTSYESLVHEMGRHAMPKRDNPVAVVARDKRLREDLLEEYLLALLVQSDNLLEQVKEVGVILREIVPKQRANQKVFHLLWEYVSSQKTYDTGSFSNFLPSELLPTFNTATLYPLGQFATGKDAYRKEINRVIEELKTRHLRVRLKELSLAIEQKEDAGDDSNSLKEQYSRTLSLLKKEAPTNDSY